jgi:hypothetical protein
MLDRIKVSLYKTTMEFRRKIIIPEGMSCWGAGEAYLLKTLDEPGWCNDGETWRPPAGMAFDAAYDELCRAVQPAPGMTRENMQPLVEGSYPEADVWFEQFGSYPELRIEGEALVFHPAPMSAADHIGWLRKREQQCREQGATGMAWEFAERAKEIETENTRLQPATAISKRSQPS